MPATIQETPQSPRRNDSPTKFQDIQNKAKTLTDDVTELLDLYYKLAVVTVTEKASNAASVTIVLTIIISLFMFMLLFAGLAVGWYLGQLLNSIFLGYTIISGFFLLLILLTIGLRKNHIFPLIRNVIVKKIYED